MSEGGADSVLVDISQGVPDHQERAELVRWGAAYLGADIGEDQAIRIGRLAIYYRDTVFRNARRRGLRLNFDRSAMLALGLLVAAVRYARQNEGDSGVRH
jgi:hypothetical protein